MAICAKLSASLGGGHARLMNDANACALAEWQFGAGRGCEHMVFLTSGTGMGAGVILNGRLYEGATGDAGEVGHLRLAEDGPLGFGKAGSFEGFCSGGGIARLAALNLWFETCRTPAILVSERRTCYARVQIADAAKAGETFALEIMHIAGKRLREALAVIVDLFNPERIVIGCLSALSRTARIPRRTNCCVSKRCLTREPPVRFCLQSSARPSGVTAQLPLRFRASAAAERPPFPCPRHLSALIERIPELAACRASIADTHKALQDCFTSGGKLLLCGNGGSAADADHWAGELLKGFGQAALGEVQEEVAALRGPSSSGRPPRHSSDEFPALSSAFCNDAAPEPRFRPTHLRAWPTR